MSGTIFFAWWISSICWCCLVAISSCQTNSSADRVLCQREGKKVLTEKVRRWQSPDLWIWWWVCRDLLHLCRTVFWARRKILRKKWTIPTSQEMPKLNKAVFQYASGNRFETRADIQLCTLERSSRNTLKVLILGNRKAEVALRTQPASGNRCKVWRHTWTGQKWSS